MAGARDRSLPGQLGSQTEPSPGEYDWSEIDPAAVTALATRGVRDPLRAQRRAGVGVGPDCVPDFVRAHLRPWARLRGRLPAPRARASRSVPGFKVQAWNEPNIPLFGNLLPETRRRADQLPLRGRTRSRSSAQPPRRAVAASLRTRGSLYRKVNRTSRWASTSIRARSSAAGPRGRLARRPSDRRRPPDLGHRDRLLVERVGRRGQATPAADAYRFLATPAMPTRSSFTASSMSPSRTVAGSARSACSTQPDSRNLPTTRCAGRFARSTRSAGGEDLSLRLANG